MPCEGDTLSLSVNEMPGITYQWFKNGEILENDTLPQLNINGLTADDSGTYSIELKADDCILSVNAYELNIELCGLVLSAEDLNLTAKYAQGKAILDWSTINNNDIQYFTIEKSKDARIWESISTIQTKNAKSDVAQYNYVDNNPYAGTTFYRIKQLNKNGKNFYSNTQSIYVDGKQQMVDLFPNPSSNYINVKSETNITSAVLVDVTGKTLMIKAVNGAEFTLTLNQFPEGTYHLILTDENGSVSSHKVTRIK